MMEGWLEFNKLLDESDKRTYRKYCEKVKARFGDEGVRVFEAIWNNDPENPKDINTLLRETGIDSATFMKVVEFLKQEGIIDTLKKDEQEKE